MYAHHLQLYSANSLCLWIRRIKYVSFYVSSVSAAGYQVIPTVSTSMYQICTLICVHNAYMCGTRLQKAADGSPERNLIQDMVIAFAQGQSMA